MDDIRLSLANTLKKTYGMAGCGRMAQRHRACGLARTKSRFEALKVHVVIYAAAYIERRSSWSVNGSVVRFGIWITCF